MEPFITTDDLGAYLRRDLTADLMAELAIGSACETLRDMCEQTFDGVVDDEVTLDGSGTDALLLPELPVQSVSSVLLGTIAVSATGYYLRDGMLLRKGHGLSGVSPVWIRGRGLYTVTYTHGYNTYSASGSGGIADLPALPRSLKMLAITMAARIYDQGLVSQETVGGYQVIYSAESSLSLTRGEMNIVAKYQPGRKR